MTDSPTDASNDLRVAYLVSQYPALSHTFIEREVHGLRARGVDVETFSVRPCPQQEQRSVLMREDARRTAVLLDDVTRSFPSAHATLLKRSPLTWASVLVRALRSGDRTARARLWQTFYFAEAVVLHDRLRRLGVRHLHVHFANVSADVARLVVEIGRRLDGDDAGWRWSLTMHGPTEFEAVEKVDLAAKVRAADGIACISDFCRSQLMRLVEPEHWPKMKVVRMSVDTDRFTPPADGRQERSGPLRILDVGRLVPEKGAPVLVDAVDGLRRRGIDVRARLVGAGELHTPLAEEVRRRGLDDVVELVGPVGQDDILHQYHWADVFCLPSFQEGLPVVLMEALATGLPVVTTRIAAIEELVQDPHMGHVVAPGRPDLLADALAELAASPERRRAAGASGRQAVIAEFTPVQSSAAMAEFLAGVVDSHR